MEIVEYRSVFLWNLGGGVWRNAKSEVLPIDSGVAFL